MSSRRAKLKVSASLPPRRKNPETADSNKQQKDISNRITKSPRTPKLGTENQEQKNSPKAKTTSDSITVSDKTTPVKLVQIPKEQTTIEQANLSKSPQKDSTSLSVNEKFTNFTENVFASPLLKLQGSNSPKRTFVSPITPSPKVNRSLDGQKLPTPQRNIPSPIAQRMNENSAPQIEKSISTPKVNKSLHIQQKPPTPQRNIPTPIAQEINKNSVPQIAKSIPTPPANENLELQKPLTPQRNIPTPIAQKIHENSELQITENIISNIRHNSRPKTSHKGNDSAMNITENINEEAMDGIVPLQPAKCLNKPIDLLKSEIISENAEVLFDPIVPLPSPTKVRHKLRPAPRLGPQRRNSIQGSASESEDESRRNLASSSSRQRHDSSTSYSTHHSVTIKEVSRARNDSVCSSVSQVTAQLPPMGSPLKDKQNKTKRQEVSRRMASMRRRRENLKRDTLTMYDLIFYNPTTNPIVPNEDEIKIQEANARAESEKNKMEDIVVEPEPPKETMAPAPQIKLGPQGEIILDEESLVIKQTDSGRKITSVVHESAWVAGGGFKYKKSTRAAEWSAAETVRFYRALAAVGTDFTLMAPLFPDRGRRELKLKFKKEEKLNGAQVDKALRAKVPWDVMKLKDEFKEERIEAKKRAERERERLQKEKKAERERMKAAREMRVRQSRGAKALESTMLPGVSTHHRDAITAEDIIERATRTKVQRKRKCTTETFTEEISTLNLATLTPVSRAMAQNNLSEVDTPKMATPNLQIKTPDLRNGVPQIPSNIETGSLVVLTVNDPSSPAKKMLQTYIAHGPGKLTPVALPTVLLNSVVGYMKKNTPNRIYSPSSQMMSPSSVTSQDSRTSSTPSGISVLPGSTNRQRHNSFTITQL